MNSQKIAITTQVARVLTSRRFNTPFSRFSARILKPTLLGVMAAISLAAHGQTLYISNLSSNEILKDSSGTVSVFAPGAPFLDPEGIAIDSVGNIYVANNGTTYSNGSITKVNSAGTSWSTYDSGSAANVSLPTVISFQNGTLYGMMQGVNTVYKLPSANILIPYASNGINGPEAIAFDASGDLFVANYGNNNILEITPAQAIAHTYTVFASLYEAAGLTFDSQGDLFATSFGNSTITEYPSGGGSRIIASGLNGPIGLAFDPNSNL